MLRKFTHLVALLTAAFLIYSCSGSGDDSAQSATTGDASAQQSQSSAETAGPEVPQFAAYDLDGTLRQSSEWIGQQPVVLNFWGTWCPPCRHELPALKRLYSEYRDQGVEILGLALDWKDNAGTVRSFSRENELHWQMLMVDRDTFADYRGTGVPTTFFLDENGRVVEMFIGPRSYEEFKVAFEAII
ncbi:redoxin domain-containing protein [candidate division GN15 bacterium]|nr:redoxin domain-containing protein [candidate division GN15 bacterium]